jgi:hypothetical protein
MSRGSYRGRARTFEDRLGGSFNACSIPSRRIKPVGFENSVREVGKAVAG